MRGRNGPASDQKIGRDDGRRAATSPPSKSRPRKEARKSPLVAKQKRRAEREAELAAKIKALPDLKFGVIYRGHPRPRSPPEGAAWRRSGGGGKE